MTKVLGTILGLTTRSSDQEFEEALNQFIDENPRRAYDIALEKVKLLYSIREIKRQARYTRLLVLATWVLAIFTAVLSTATLVVR